MPPHPETKLTARPRQEQPAPPLSFRTMSTSIRRQYGKIGYIIFWLLGVPLPILFIIYLLRGCS